MWDAQLAMSVSIVSYHTGRLAVLTCCKDIEVIRLCHVIVVLKLIQGLPTSGAHVRRKQVVDNISCEGFLVHWDCPRQCGGTQPRHLVGHIGEYLVTVEVDGVSSNPI